MNFRSTNILNFYDSVTRIFNNDSLTHAYLIEVSNYGTDYADVLKFVKLILCSKNDKSIDKVDCGECNTCSLIDEGNYPDLYVIEPDGNNIKKEQILLLEREFNNASLLDNKRIYIIKEAEKMNSFAANTILKFLEEPSPNIIAILLTRNRYKIIDTILSRCQLLSLKSVDSNEDFSDYAYFSKFLVDPDDLFLNYDDIINKLFVDEEKKIDKKKMKDFFLGLSKLLLDYYNQSGNIDDNTIKVLDRIDHDKIFNFISIIEEEIGNLDFNVNNKLWLDRLFSKFIGGSYD